MSICDLIEHRINESFPFEVELRQLSAGGVESPHAGFYRNDCTDETGWLPHAVSRGYTPHSRQDVIDATKAGVIAMGINKESDLNIECSWDRMGHRVAVLPSDDQRTMIAKDDGVWPSLIVRANYGRAFTISGAIKRDACSNLMMMRVVSQTTVSLRHRSNFRRHFDQTVDRMSEVTHKHEDIMEFCRMLTRKEISSKAIDQYLIDVLPQPRTVSGSKSSTKQWEKKASAILSRLRDEQLKLNASVSSTNLWQIANAVTGWVQHDSVRQGRPSKVDREFMALDDNRCHKAWDIAAELAC